MYEACNQEHVDRLVMVSTATTCVYKVRIFSGGQVLCNTQP